MQQIKVMNNIYEIEFTNDLYDVYGAYGLFNSRTNVIKIQNNMQQDNMKAKLLHELIHAIDEQLQLQLSEQQVSCIAENIITFSDIEFKFVK
jgi:Zn-dependent peptidase ImmA (M78 family)